MDHGRSLCGSCGLLLVTPRAPPSMLGAVHSVHSRRLKQARRVQINQKFINILSIRTAFNSNPSLRKTATRPMEAASVYVPGYAYGRRFSDRKSTPPPPALGPD